MAKLSLDVRLDGFAEPVGTLRRDNNGALSFAYDVGHLADPAALPLSLSLPLTDEPFVDPIARPFFDNLLQERNDPLQLVMDREGLARDDVAGLLLHLGKDCAGALSVLPQGAPPVKVPGDYETDYLPLAEDRIEAIVRALHERRRLPKGTNDPSPLAGVQSKIALTLLPDGRLAEPRPGTGAPTTHILKVPGRERPRDASYEAAGMELSRLAGIETAETATRTIGGVETLMIARFDRFRTEDGKIARCHQEDFAQALGLPASLKYERNGAEGRRFDATAIRRILDATAEPAIARQTFVNATLFDLMIGNVDAHAKNHALLYTRGARPVLAPRYDLLPTRLDPTLTDELPFRIGAATSLEALTSANIDIFLGLLGISTPAAQRRLRTNEARVLAAALTPMLAGLTRIGLKLFADLIASNLRSLLPILALPVPPEAQHRDAFIPRGGGWE